jgi:hypothetical protein
LLNLLIEVSEFVIQFGKHCSAAFDLLIEVAKVMNKDAD